jgi:ADP-heptose:LPS heptosyltransferase
MSRPTALAVCTTALGDLLLCTPALEALGRVYELDVLAHRRRLPLLLGNPHISLLYPYRNNFFYRLGLSMRLGRREYDALAVLHANDGILKLLPDLRYRRAANIQGWDRPELNLVALAPDESLHVVDKRLALARWAGAPEVDGRLRVYLSREELARGRAWLADHGLGSAPTAALCPGAAQVYKTWPPEHFGALLRSLADQGVGVLLIGAKSEKALAARVMQSAGREAAVALGLPLRLLAGVLAGVDLLISNCTGPLHLAQAVGAPVLGLYGPTDPATIGPRGSGNRVLQTPRTCDPCTTKACQDPKCMAALGPEAVLETALDMLAPPGAGGRP